MNKKNIKYINKTSENDLTIFDISLSVNLYNQLKYDNLFSFNENIFSKPPPKLYNDPAIISIIGLDKDIVSFNKESVTIDVNKWLILRIKTIDETYTTLYHNLLNSTSENVYEDILSFSYSTIKNKNPNHIFDEIKYKSIIKELTENLSFSKPDIKKYLKNTEDLLKSNNVKDILIDSLKFDNIVFVNKEIIKVLKNKNNFKNLGNNKYIYTEEYKNIHWLVELEVKNNRIYVFSFNNQLINEDQVSWILLELNAINKTIEHGNFFLDIDLMKVIFCLNIHISEIIHNYTTFLKFVKINQDTMYYFILGFNKLVNAEKFID